MNYVLAGRTIGAVLARSQGAAFTPLSLSPVLWLDASQLAGLSDGAAIATWTDASGNGNDMAQATAGARPTYKTNIINGKPTVRFDGGDYLLRATLALPSPVGSTLFWIAKRTGTGEFLTFAEIANYARIVYRTSGVSLTNDLHFIGWADSGTSAVVPSSAINNASARDNFSVCTLSYNGGAANSIGSYAVHVNGAPQTIVDGGALSQLARASGVGIGARATGAGFWSGDIAEIIIYGSALSAANRQAIEAYLSAKYDISLA